MLYILNIDGVIADVSHLLPLIQGPKKDYDQYYRRIGEAKPIAEGLFHYASIKLGANRAVFATGRLDSCRKVTEAWLEHHSMTWVTEPMMMRKDGDRRPTCAVKETMVKRLKEQALWKHGEVICIDDDPEVCEMYRRHGAYVMQVFCDS